MSRAALLALADRCEKASGPDREIDALIADVTGWWLTERDRLGGNAPRVMEAAPFTASLDAAITLVPQGHDWTIYVGDNGRAQAGCAPADVDDFCVADHSDCLAATDALALTAASLRARAQQESAS